MPLFRRKKRESEEFELPEPPLTPALPSNPEFKSYTQHIPELPEPASTEKSIKEEMDVPATQSMPTNLQEFSKISMDEFDQQERVVPQTPTRVMPNQPQIPSAQEITQPSRKSFPVERPIFVKINKFRESVESLNEIKKKLKEASTILQKLKEIRAKEDEELASWEKDLEEMKTKIDSIDKKLFSKIE